MRIVCQKTILMKYQALFFIFEKSNTIWNWRLLQIIGGALLVKEKIPEANFQNWNRFGRNGLVLAPRNKLCVMLNWTEHEINPANMLKCQHLLAF